MEVTTRQEQAVESAMREAGVPEHLHGGLVRYIVHRIPPGSFMEAVLSNDLREAMGRADEASRHGLFEIVSFLYNNAPCGCWGSPANVKAWLKGRDA